MTHSVFGEPHPNYRADYQTWGVGYNVVVDSSKDLLWIYETIKKLNNHNIRYKILWVRKPFKLFRISHRKRGIKVLKTIWYNISFSLRLHGMSLNFERIEYTDLVNRKEIKFTDFYQKVEREYSKIPDSYHGIFGSDSIRDIADKGIIIKPTAKSRLTAFDRLLIRDSSGIFTRGIFRFWIFLSKFKRRRLGNV